MYNYSFLTLLRLSMAVCRYRALWKSLPLTGEIGFAPLGCSTLRGGTLFSKFPDSYPKIQRTFVATSKKLFFLFSFGLVECGCLPKAVIIFLFSFVVHFSYLCRALLLHRCSLICPQGTPLPKCPYWEKYISNISHDY